LEINAGNEVMLCNYNNFVTNNCIIAIYSFDTDQLY